MYVRLNCSGLLNSLPKQKTKQNALRVALVGREEDILGFGTVLPYKLKTGSKILNSNNFSTSTFTSKMTEACFSPAVAHLHFLYVSDLSRFCAG